MPLNRPSASRRSANVARSAVCCSPPLIERYGPDVKTRDVMDRLKCAECGKAVSVSLQATDLAVGGKMKG